MSDKTLQCTRAWSVLKSLELISSYRSPPHPSIPAFADITAVCCLTCSCPMLALYSVPTAKCVSAFVSALCEACGKGPIICLLSVVGESVDIHIESVSLAVRTILPVFCLTWVKWVSEVYQAQYIKFFIQLIKKKKVLGQAWRARRVGVWRQPGLHTGTLFCVCVCPLFSYCLIYFSRYLHG